MPHDLRNQPEPPKPLSERNQRWLNARDQFKSDPQRYIAQLEELARDGRPGSKITVGRFYCWDSSLPHDYEKAEFWFRQAAEQDPGRANWYLGLMFALRSKYGAAIEAFEASAADDYAPAYYYLGAIYFTGVAVPQDLPAARHYLERAYSMGSLPAGAMLGQLLLRKGRGLREKISGMAIGLRAAMAYAWAQQAGRAKGELFHGMIGLSKNAQPLAKV